MKRARILLAAAAMSVLAGAGLVAATWHISYSYGIYCSVGLASTDGCDTGPPDPAGRWTAIAVMLTAIPLLAAVFGQLHLDKVRLHVDRRLDEHHRKLSGQIGAAATAPARPRRRRAAFAAVLAAMAVLLVVRAVRGKTQRGGCL